jgi:hypothetical protein
MKRNVMSMSLDIHMHLLLLLLPLPLLLPCQRPSHAQSPLEEAMDRINKFILNEMQMPVDLYLRACDKVNDENWARIVVKINELAFKRWLVKLILPEDT